MSQSIYTADEAVRHINHALKLAGSSVLVTATIDGDSLIVRCASLDSGYVLPFPRSPFGYWFAETLVDKAAPYFSAIG